MSKRTKVGLRCPAAHDHGGAAAPPYQIALDAEQAGALSRLLAHLEETGEEKHYLEAGRPEGHVWADVVRLRELITARQEPRPTGRKGSAAKRLET